MSAACELPFSYRNLIGPPITDPLYADSLALRSHMESYDYLVSQPSVLNVEQTERFMQIMAEERKPLPEDPLPLDGEAE